MSEQITDVISVANIPFFSVHTAVSVRIVHRHDFCGEYTSFHVHTTVSVRTVDRHDLCGEYAFLLHRLHTAASVRTVHRHDVYGLYTFLLRKDKEESVKQFTGMAACRQ